jgi:peptidoglycan lytic transglycosylase
MNRVSFFLLCVISSLVIGGCSKAIIKRPISQPLPFPKVARKAVPPLSQGSPLPYAPPKSRKERPYAVNGKWYFPISSVTDYREEGVCSWYGPDFHGKSTSSGETYDMFEYTAAHRTLPFNTLVRVTNPVNNKEIMVRINDRGPFLKDRILDLSYNAAKELGLVGPGTAWVQLTALGILEEGEENGRKVNKLVQEVDFQKGAFSVQIGAFKEQQNAQGLKERLLKEYPQVEISQTVQSGETFYQVRVTHCTQLKEALLLQKQLEGKGFVQAMVVAE